MRCVFPSSRERVIVLGLKAPKHAALIKGKRILPGGLVELERVRSQEQTDSEFLSSPQAAVRLCALSSVRSCQTRALAGSQTRGDPRTAPGLGHFSASQAHRALVVQPARFGTMFEDRWSRSSWRATWILFFSFLIHSTPAQGKRGTGSAPSRPVPVHVHWWEALVRVLCGRFSNVGTMDLGYSFRRFPHLHPSPHLCGLNYSFIVSLHIQTPQCLIKLVSVRGTELKFQLKHPNV